MLSSPCSKNPEMRGRRVCEAIEIAGALAPARWTATPMSRDFEGTRLLRSRLVKTDEGDLGAGGIQGERYDAHLLAALGDKGDVVV